MSRKNIQIVQNILKSDNNYDLSLKLDNAYYDSSEVNCWDGYTTAEVKIFVNPSYYLDLVSLNKSSLKKLLAIINGLSHKYDEIVSIKFCIDEKINPESFNDVLYIFIDESGNLDFTEKGSKYFMFNFLIKKRPFLSHNAISNYRYTLLERNLDPLGGRRLNIEKFHACDDNKFIKEEMFKIISSFDTSIVQVYSYILEKPKVNPDTRNQDDKFYIDNLTYAIKKLLDTLDIDKDFIIITDNLPVKKNEKKQVKALKQGVAEYIQDNRSQLRYDIFHHSSSSSVNLQIVDYVGWAINRKYEHCQDHYFKIIEKYVLKIDNMTESRNEKCY